MILKALRMLHNTFVEGRKENREIQ